MLKPTDPKSAPHERPSPIETAGSAATTGWKGVELVLRPVLALLGAGLIIAGIPIAIATPLIPIGLPVIILGVVLLARNSLAGRRWMQRTLKRHPSLKRFAPDWLVRLILGRDKHA
ncbi:MAG: hypothetical protein AAGB25_03615 [Pseudomonadota bacterium]